MLVSPHSRSSLMSSAHDHACPIMLTTQAPCPFGLTFLSIVCKFQILWHETKQDSGHAAEADAASWTGVTSKQTCMYWQLEKFFQMR
jgi:hypothetical protein